MKNKGIWIVWIALILLLIPFWGLGEFVFEDVPVESLEPSTTSESPSEAALLDALEQSDGLEQNDAQSQSNASSQSAGLDGGESGFTFEDVPVSDEESPIITPTRAPIENDTWPKEIVVTFGGDCVIGNTVAQSSSALGFKAVVEREGYAWPFSGIVSVLSQDDLSLVNFEGTLTDQEDRAEKLYNFKGPKEYSQILNLGSVEAVNLANNHFIDYGEQGQVDTTQALDDAGITYCAGNQTAIYEVRGVKIGLIGNSFPYYDEKRDITSDVKELRNAGCQIVIASFHWGSEGVYGFTREQRKIGRAAIKSGADIVVGHHPHVIQSVEKYDGTYILYSLGNLVFGGNVDPKDKDTFLAQVTFTVNEDGSLQGEPMLKLIPVLLTSQSKGTDYRPVVVSDEKAYDRIMIKILGKATNMESFVNPSTPPS